MFEQSRKTKSFTEQELEELKRLYADGLSSKEVANHIGIGYATLKKYIENSNYTIKKLKWASSRSQRLSNHLKDPNTKLLTKAIKAIRMYPETPLTELEKITGVPLDVLELVRDRNRR